MLSPAAIPDATYRLRFSRSFTFRDAEKLIPYLSALGISHIYASSYLKVRAGSPHGYEITDHNALNPELGDAESFEAMVAALQRHGMGQILDFVPNHMRIGKADKEWWLDLLEWGRTPGGPDIYQGSELWDLNLVDPDNRRPVDWERRSKLLAELCAREAASEEV